MNACAFTCAIHAHRDQRPAVAVTPQEHYLMFLSRPLTGLGLLI